MDFKDLIIEKGWLPHKEPILADGAFHRFSTNGEPSDDAGWYVASELEDGVIVAAFGCFRSGTKYKFCNTSTKKLSGEQRLTIKRQ